MACMNVGGDLATCLGIALAPPVIVVPNFCWLLPNGSHWCW